MSDRRKPKGRNPRKTKMVIITKKKGVTIIAEGTPEAFEKLAKGGA